MTDAEIDAARRLATDWRAADKREFVAYIADDIAAHLRAALDENVRLRSRLMDVADAIRAGNGESDGISPGRCEAILERIDRELSHLNTPTLNTPKSAK